MSRFQIILVLNTSLKEKINFACKIYLSVVITHNHNSDLHTGNTFNSR